MCPTRSTDDPTDVWILSARVAHACRMFVVFTCAVVLCAVACDASTTVRLRTAVDLRATGDVAGAAATLRRAAAWAAPGDARPYEALATLLTTAASTARFDETGLHGLREAERALQYVAARQPGNARARGELGWIALMSGAYRDAQVHAREALALAPRNPELWRLLGESLHADGQTDAAIDAFHASLELRDSRGLRAWLEVLER